MSPFVRAAAVAAALLLAAWFGLAVVQARALDRARAELFRPGPLTAQDAAGVRDAIDRAAFFNPDTDVDVLRAGLATRRGRWEDARRILLDVVAREPDNITAWTAIAVNAEQPQPALSERARDELRRLQPLPRS